jgi:hypothetical protein
MALLTAHYLRYLIYAFSEKKFNSWEKVILFTSGSILALAAFAVPVYMFIWAPTLRAAPDGQQVVVTLLFLLLGIVILELTRRYKIIWLVVAAALFNALAFVFVVPFYQEMKEASGKQRGIPELEEVRKRTELKSIKFYAVGGMRPEDIWEVGKEVDTLKNIDGHLQLPVELPAVVFSLSPLQQTDFPGKNTSLQFFSQYQYMDGVAGEKYYMYILARDVCF